MQIDILRARSNQAETLTNIAFAAKRHWGYPEQWIQHWSAVLTITPEFIQRNETYVAFLDHQPVGFAAISLKEEKASLEHLWVLPEHMGKGIGTSLFSQVLCRCKELDARFLEIESDPHAQGFYEHRGAKKVGEVVGKVDGHPRALPLLEMTL